MPRYATVSPHLSVDDLARRYRQSHDPVARTHWQIVWLVAQSHHVPEVAQIVGYTANWVRAIIRRYNAGGPDALVDQRSFHRGGNPPLLSPTLLAELAEAVAAGSAPDGGVWSCRQAAAWMSARLGRPVADVRGWEALRALGFTLQRPRPTATHADPVAQDAFKKGGLQAEVDALRAAHPTATLTVWAMDEHRLGLLPVTRRVWAKRGQRPTAWVRRRDQWLYVYGFVRPRTGQTWWCLLPTVSAPAMTAALAAFAHDEGLDARHRAVLVLDGAGWHTANGLAIPDGIDLVFLPPASPERQPAERLWPLVDEPVANRTFADLDALEEVLVTRCQVLAADHRRLQGHTRYHWWPQERRPHRSAQ